MNKKIEDYLHLYLGCDIALKTTYAPNSYKLACIWNVGTVGLYKNGLSYPVQMFNVEYVKPILRPLESITEEERAAIWEIVFNRPFPKSGRTMIADRETHDAYPRWILMSGVERLGISFNGYDVWADSDLQHWKHNQHEITRYLLSKHFDLFDLIPSGLAISSNSKSK